MNHCTRPFENNLRLNQQCLHLPFLLGYILCFFLSMLSFSLVQIISFFTFLILSIVFFYLCILFLFSLVKIISFFMFFDSFNCSMVLLGGRWRWRECGGIWDIDSFVFCRRCATSYRNGNKREIVIKGSFSASSTHPIETLAHRDRKRCVDECRFG